MDGTDIILINGLEFYGFHGASDEEQVVGHRYQVDVRLAVDIRAAAISDRIADTVNYAAVAKTIVRVGTSSQFRLIEALAEHIVDRLFVEYKRVTGVQLRVSKILPPMNAIAQSVGVEITRSRAEPIESTERPSDV